MRALEDVDPRNFDRIVSFDPLVAATADRVVPIWRSLPLPVADRFYMEPIERREEPDVLFVGRSTEHRERFLTPAKHQYDVMHMAHGVSAERLLGLLAEVDIGLNLHSEPYASFENRVSIFAAAGLLVITEPLSPTHGFEPGIDYVEVHNPDELMSVLFDARRDIAAYRRIRILGRAKAERSRASRVYPDLVRDLLRDVAAYGSSRLPDGAAR
jgi:hypothetical protein